jgi:hypothetical protein
MTAILALTSSSGRNKAHGIGTKLAETKRYLARLGRVRGVFPSPSSIDHVIGLRILREATEGFAGSPQDESLDLNLSHGSLIDMFMYTGLQALVTGSSLLDKKI